MSDGPGGITWSFSNVATAQEIVACFDHLELDEIIHHNWGTGPLDQRDHWQVTDETYINGVPLIMDFDYRMGFLIEAVDRPTGQCTYVAVVQYHGRRPDGTFEHDYRAWEGTHRLFDHDDGYNPAAVARWAVTTIHGMIENHDEAQP